MVGCLASNYSCFQILASNCPILLSELSTLELGGRVSDEVDCKRTPNWLSQWRSASLKIAHSKPYRVVAFAVATIGA